MSDNEDTGPGLFSPFEIDPVTHNRVSPQRLPEYRGSSALPEIDQAYEALNVAQTAESFYQAISGLVFHARH